MTDENKATEVDSWAKRRKVIYLSLGVCASGILFGALNVYLEPSVAAVLITQGFWVGSVIVGSYAFAATWDDKGKPKK